MLQHPGQARVLTAIEGERSAAGLLPDGRPHQAAARFINCFFPWSHTHTYVDWTWTEHVHLLNVRDDAWQILHVSRRHGGRPRCSSTVPHAIRAARQLLRRGEGEGILSSASEAADELEAPSDPSSSGNQPLASYHAVLASCLLLISRTHYASAFTISNITSRRRRGARVKPVI